MSEQFSVHIYRWAPERQFRVLYWQREPSDFYGTSGCEDFATVPEAPARAKQFASPMCRACMFDELGKSGVKHNIRADRDAPSRALASCAHGRALSRSSPSPPAASHGRGGPTSRCPPSPARSPARAGTAGSSSGSRTTGGGHDKAARKNQGRPQAALRGLHPQILRGRARAGVQLAPRPARGLRGVHSQPALRGLGACPRSV